MANDKMDRRGFLVKTFHHDRYWSATPKEHREEFIVDRGRSQDHNKDHDNIWCINPEKTCAFMKEVKKPWIAYKVLELVLIPVLKPALVTDVSCTEVADAAQE